MMNQHVFRYFRWLGWCAEQEGKHWSAFLYRDFARQEADLSSFNTPEIFPGTMDALDNLICIRTAHEPGEDR